MRSTLRRGAVVALGATAALSLGFGSAVADPNYNDNGAINPAGFHPDSNDLVGTGSDTTQYVTNALARGYNGPDGVRMASFDALNPATNTAGGSIVIRDPEQDTPYPAGPADADDVSITRPNGSSQGVSTLSNNTNVDFARSSRPSNGSAAESLLKFIPFASDGLSYIVDDGLSFVPTNLGVAELRDIYTCQLPGYNAKLPQAGSGTRAFFLTQIGVTEAQITQAVADGCVDASVQEHDAAAVEGDPWALAPFSEARYRENPRDPNNPPVNSSTLVSDVDSAAFFTQRDVYHVVRNAQWIDPVAGPRLVSAFGTGGYVCSVMNADGDGDGVGDGLQGFRSIGDRCGS